MWTTLTCGRASCARCPKDQGEAAAPIPSAGQARLWSPRGSVSGSRLASGQARGLGGRRGLRPEPTGERASSAMSAPGCPGPPCRVGGLRGPSFFGLNNRSLFSQDSGGWKPEIRCWQGWSHSEASLLGGFQAAPFCSIVTRSSQCVHVCLTSFVCVCVLLRYH